MTHKDQNPGAGLSAGLGARNAAATLLRVTLRKGESLDDAMASSRAFDALEGSDRAFARALTSTTLRRLGQIDDVIERFIDKPLGRNGADAQDILRLTAAQLLFLDTPAHAAVSTAVDLAAQRASAKRLKGLINAVSRRIAERGRDIVKDQHVRLNTPAWMWRSWERAYGPKTARAIAEAHLKEASLDITPKDDARLWADRLEADILPTDTLRRATVSNVAELAGFADGGWWPQDAAAALPVRLLGDVRGKRVIDLCAAPGGKALQLAAAGARVTAVDKSDDRLGRLRGNLARTSLDADIVVADALDWRPEEPADAVLLDAPCTATGTIRRHPDLPWRKREADVASLAELQAKMIDAALDMAKPGATVVYCVCSLQPEESEAQARAALARHDGLVRKGVAPSEIGGLEPAVSRDLDLRTLPSFWPETGGMDGFFAARFVKKR